MASITQKRCGALYPFCSLQKNMNRFSECLKKICFEKIVKDDSENCTKNEVLH